MRPSLCCVKLDRRADVLTHVFYLWQVLLMTMIDKEKIETALYYLRSNRAACDLTRDQLGKQLGVSGTYLYSLETGRIRWDRRLLARYVEATRARISQEYLDALLQVPEAKEGKVAISAEILLSQDEALRTLATAFSVSKSEVLRKLIDAGWREYCADQGADQKSDQPAT